VIPDTAPLNDLVQHAVVSIVALGALGVVLRRVLGVFDRRPSTTPGATTQGAPGCSHCAAGSAVHKKHSRA
jgi:hypothetical protein